MDSQFDAIVVGSGISGGWAAKELCERGLKVALVERGRKVEHMADYKTEVLAPWELPHRGFGDQAKYDRDYPQQQGLYFNEWTEKFWVNDTENPYEATGTKPFQWRRGYQLGGRSLTWGRHVFRRDDHDFEANLKDGHGVDWPIRYADIAPWYKHVEEFIGVSGDAEDHVEGLPNSVFQAPFEMTEPEKAFRRSLIENYGGSRQAIIGRIAHLREAKEGRAPCQSRVICSRGCSYGAYFSTQSSTLPAALKTGNLTVLTDCLVEKVAYDAQSGRATGISYLRGDGTRQQLTAKLIFINASTLNSIGLLLRSANEAMPNGFGNRSGALGKGIMDHGMAYFMGRISGFDEHYYAVNRPASLIIPRFVNITEPLESAVRGYSFQGETFRRSFIRGAEQPGIGKDLKASMREPGDWMIALACFVEALPIDSNSVVLSKSKTDKFGLPLLEVHYEHTENEKVLAKHGMAEAEKMVELMGWKKLHAMDELGAPGSAVHEMGGARMGRDPLTSVLNGFNQMHDVPNVFVTDGAAMSSSGTVNPSLTYMALTARAADHAVNLLKSGAL